MSPKTSSTILETTTGVKRTTTSTILLSTQTTVTTTNLQITTTRLTHIRITLTTTSTTTNLPKTITNSLRTKGIQTTNITKRVIILNKPITNQITKIQIIPQTKRLQVGKRSGTIISQIQIKIIQTIIRVVITTEAALSTLARTTISMLRNKKSEVF